MSRSALNIIHEEHRALAAMLRSLRMLADRMRERASASDFDLMRAILFYIDEFPERLHHAKESGVLFPRLRLRAPQASAVLDRLDAEHARGEAQIRELEHLLLAFEQMGAPRRQAFLDGLERYVRFYLEHMQIEERDMLPLAAATLSEDDWREIDRSFDENRDPLTGHKPSEQYEALFTKILSSAPAPIGLGPAS